MLIEGFDTFLSEDQIERFERLLKFVPEKRRTGYEKRVYGAVHHKSPVVGYSTILGVLFELENIDFFLKQGLEFIDFSMETTDEVVFLGYSKKGSPSAVPTIPMSEFIDFDIPINRNGKPYVLELKSYPRMQFGESAGARNQLLKYQAAIDQGIIDGATIEIRGRIHPSFLDWIIAGYIPNVEVVYLIELPSGAWYRFVIKPTKNRNGLRFKNEAPQTPDDRVIIDGIECAIRDNSTIDIVRGIEVHNPPKHLTSYLDNPDTIQELSILKECLPVWQKAIWRAFI